jgi:hypothetical protein
VLLVVERGSLQEQLWAEPPIRNVNGLLRLLQSLGNGPEVVSAVDVPLDQVAVSFRREAVEAVALGNLTPLGVRRLLVRLVMAMVGIEEVGELSNLVLEVYRLDVRASQLGVLKLLLDFLDLFRDTVVEGVEDLLKTLFLGHVAAVAGGQQQRGEAMAMLGLRIEASGGGG